MGFDPISYTSTQSNTQAISELSYQPQVAVAESKTLALTDTGTMQKVTAAATITIPANATVAFPINTQIDILSYTASDAAIAPADGVTLYPASTRKINGQYTAATLKKIDTNEWVLFGSLKA